MWDDFLANGSQPIELEMMDGVRIINVLECKMSIEERLIALIGKMGKLGNYKILIGN